MKRIICFLGVILIVGVIWSYYSKPQLSFSQEFYQMSNSSNCVIQDSLGFFNTGESGSVNGDYQKIIEEFNAKICFYEYTQNGFSIYCFTNKLKYRIKLKGQVINLHIFVGDNQIKVGSPIIFGSY